MAMAAPSPGYTNNATIIYAPNYSGNTVSSIQVDATNFVNNGTWEIYTQDRYHPADTLNYINEGTMWGEVGWDFALYPSTTGQRGMSASFLNDYGAVIQAVDIPIINPYPEGEDFPSSVSYLWISATNIVNYGTLIGDSGGEIRLTGSNVDLSLGTLEIDGIGSYEGGRGSSFNNFSKTNFLPAMAIYDEYWGQTNIFPGFTPNTMDSSIIWNGTVSMSPVFYVSAPCGVSNATVQTGFAPTLADSMSIDGAYTNIVYTNFDGSAGTSSVPAQIFRQAVFVGISDANTTAADSFLNTGNPTNLFRTVTVRLTAPSGDALYLVDTLGSLTNRGLLLNEDTTPEDIDNPRTPCTDPTYRPANYDLEGIADFGGSPGAGPPAANFLYDPSFTNAIVPAIYAGYSAYVDDLARNPSGTAVTDLPGRIIIDATNLDLSQTIISSQGAEITIHAGNLIDSTGAAVSCQNLSYNLGSAVGNLNVTNLAGNSSIPGPFNGTIYAFSALWTNGYPMLISSYSQVVTNNTTNMVFTPITNNVQVDLHVLLLDATGLSSMVQETVQDLILHSTNMVVSDSMNVVGTLLFDGQSLTLLTNLTLSGNLTDWNSATAPNLRYFTNNGTLSIPQNAHFGDDRLTNYAAFVNNGSINAIGGSETINSTYYQSSGSQNAPGGYSVTTSTGLVENAVITSGQSVSFTAVSLTLDNSMITAGRTLNFNVTGNLTDMGCFSGNTLTCNQGFNLPFKPATGDLLGTIIQSTAPNRTVVTNVWAATNLGPSAVGFSNNVAIGELILDAQGSNSYFRFNGTGVSNAIYVGNLELLDYASYTNHDISGNIIPTLTFNTNLVIYYAKATVAGGVDVSDKMNHKNNDHFQWVTNYTGCFIGINYTNLVYPGGIIYTVNAALAQSTTLDSNGNGIPNAIDPLPFFEPCQVDFTETLTNNPLPTMLLTWHSIPSATNTVSYSTNVGGPYVLVLTNFVSPSVLPAGGWPITNTVADPIGTNHLRTYRVLVYPNSTCVYGQ